MQQAENQPLTLESSPSKYIQNEEYAQGVTSEEIRRTSILNLMKRRSTQRLLSPKDGSPKIRRKIGLTETDSPKDNNEEGNRIVEILKIEPKMRKPAEIQELARLLEDITFFQNLKEEGDKEIYLRSCSLLGYQKYRKGETIFREGI